MALDAGFVAGILEGIEGTLDEVIERVNNPELKASLDALQTTVTALRTSIEPSGGSSDRDKKSEESVALEAA